jgi:hypothetical protein
MTMNSGAQIAFWSRTNGAIRVTYSDGSVQWLLRSKDGFYASVPVHIHTKPGKR